MPLVSIIVPVFNCEEYLKECLDSIVEQSIKDIQVICIDDASTDDSGKILHSYASRDTRLEILHSNARKGPGAARNAGLKKAIGKYLRMVDADDYIPLDSTEKLVTIAEEYKSDMVRGGYYKTDSNDNNIVKKGGRFPEKLLINASIKNNRELWYFDQHTTYLYNTRLVKETAKCQYSEEMKNGEDVAFLLQLFPYMNRVSLIPETVYFYRQSPRSTVRGKKDKQYFLNLFRLFDMEYSKLAPIGYKEQVDYFIYSHFLTILPFRVLPAIPDNLDDRDALEVLDSLKGIIEKFALHELFFSKQYQWQADFFLPLLSLQIILLLAGGYTPEALEYLQEQRQKDKLIQSLRKEKREVLKKLRQKEKTVVSLQSKIYLIQNSTSWRITEPLRNLIKYLT